MSRLTALTPLASAAIVLLALTGCSASSGETATAPADSAAQPQEEAPAEPQNPGFNTPVAVGDFEYTVTGFAELGTEVGEAPLSQTAQGTYVQLDLSVTNIGKKSETFFDNYVSLVDAEGRQYDADSMASIYLDTDSAWISGINPGNTMAGVVVFDMPVGVAAVSLLVKKNMFSDDGTLIDLK